MTFEWPVVWDNLPLLLQGAATTVVLTVVTMALAIPGVLKIISRYQDRVIERAILPKTRWKPGELEGQIPSPAA